VYHYPTQSFNLQKINVGAKSSKSLDTPTVCQDSFCQMLLSDVLNNKEMHLSYKEVAQEW